MFSRIAKPAIRSAAWRISFWATLAFACGTMLVFLFLQRYVAGDLQQRSDAWLSGEVEVLGDVAARTPKDALYDRVVKEVAELASKEVPNHLRSGSGSGDAVFFLQTAADGSLKLWVGNGNGGAKLAALKQGEIAPDQPFDLRLPNVKVPYRVATVPLKDGSHIYLGLSERDELQSLRRLRIRFFFLWLAIVLLGLAIVFCTTKRMLWHVREISEAASRIGRSDLSSRVPATKRNDEVSQLAHTLNKMLDRIENSMHQLHNITGSLAHDLRSPLTAIRAKLEASLLAESSGAQTESIVVAVEELDRLTEFLNQSLDVAEAKADALRLNRREVDLDELLQLMIALYGPSMSEKGLQIRLRSGGPLRAFADAGLTHRVLANLFDNELKHLPAACTICIELCAKQDRAVLKLEDDGPGFPPEVVRHLFEQRTKGGASSGHGLGLAFVQAVVHAHGGSIAAFNRPEGGVRLEIELPTLASIENEVSSPSFAAR